MPSCGMWLRMCVVRTDVSKELIASVFRLEIIRELGTTLKVSSKPLLASLLMLW
jgi:hypothetical protein